MSYSDFNPVTDYLYPIYNPKLFKKVVNRAAYIIKKILIKTGFDTIAFTGSSGAAIAYPVSYKLDVPLTHIRKGKRHHCSYQVEGRYDIEKYIILDDRVDSGDTLLRIIKSMNKAVHEPELVGIVLYNEPQSLPSSDWVYHKKHIEQVIGIDKKVEIFNFCLY
jgi:adenine/guanine phosphoribosyltransferase-like PRPP-binding protein